MQTTVEAVQEGKCVIDFGATKSLRSIYALEKLMARNIKETGDAAVQHVDHKFGNSSSDRCQEPRRMKIHALDRGQRTGAPFRRLGALMDFANDLMVLSKLNKKRIIRLERFATGHQVVETGLITGQDIFLLPGTGEELQESSSKRVRFECDAFDSVSTEHHEKRLQGSRPTVYSVILLNSVTARSNDL